MCIGLFLIKVQVVRLRPTNDFMSIILPSTMNAPPALSVGNEYTHFTRKHSI